jgi:hypothetical protein
VRIAAIIVTIVTVLWTVGLTRGCAVATNEYQNQIHNHWELADRSSTIKDKSVHLDKYVSALESAGLQGEYDAMWLKSPTVSFDANLAALKTLQSRLHEVEDMDPNSFAYQQAISQITAQEQGEAQEMLGVFAGCWEKQNYLYLWSWIGGIQWLLIIVGVFASIFLWIESSW